MVRGSGLELEDGRVQPDVRTRLSWALRPRDIAQLFFEVCVRRQRDREVRKLGFGHLGE